MLKTAVIGASSYIGKHLIKMYRKKFPDCIGTFFKNKSSANKYFNLHNSSIKKLKLLETGHESVIITAAQPNIGFCEKNKKLSYDLNVKAPLRIIKDLSKTSIKIIFLSSDYVFQGNKGNNSDYDKTNPTTIYGKQKKEVEEKIKKISKDITILRLGKIFGLKKNDNTLLDQPAKLLSKKKDVLAATDQYFCPTLINDLTDVINKIQLSNLKGIINVCSNEIWSRYDLHISLANALDVNKKFVKKINLHDLPGFKKRPLNTSMKCNKLRKAIIHRFKPMSESIKIIAKNYYQ
jgi:dTDP-4-dehydrorhamnose reductase|tara:strand:+ start:441 stop:1316 length:876 start_codon:yes stop_codon:yes gene_type:complete